MSQSLRLTVVLALFVTVGVDLLATCGGGGGGGTGGMGASAEQVYPVPWKNAKLGDALPAGGLVIYWFPLSQNEFEKSSLRNSRALSLRAAQCVAMGVADRRSDLAQKVLTDEPSPIAVLAQADGKVIGKAEGVNGFLKVQQVEKLLETEMKLRQTAVKDAVKEAKDKAKRGEKDAAIAQYRNVVDQKCLFPNEAKEASKELGKLGVAGGGPLFDAPVFDPTVSARIEDNVKRGLAAEEASKFGDAEKLYRQASRLDPADPTPLRYLGELYRHHIGDWDKARKTFDLILAMPADPLSRAVALHGLGKMTIHEGAFKKGLGLMEESSREFPLALTFRNLAVYWNSEGDQAKAGDYTRQALALDPNDPFNLVFSAAYLAGTGQGDAALKVAKEHEALLPASYNLAAIYAQLGQKDKALAFLQRHFYEYERNKSVRSKEMMEARVDAVFSSLLGSPEFMALTADADNRLQMPSMKGMGGGR